MRLFLRFTGRVVEFETGNYVRVNGNKAISLKWICIIFNYLKKQAAKDNPIIYHGLSLRALCT